MWSFKQQFLISHHQTVHFIGAVILCETKEQTQNVYGLILLSIKSSQALLLTYAYQFRIFDLGNKINTATENNRGRQKNSLLECSVFTLRKIEDSSLRWNNCSQEEGNWIWDTAANIMKRWGQGCDISATGLHVLYQLYEVGFAKLLIPVGESGRPKFLNLCCQTCPVKWGGKQCAQPASHPFRRAFLCLSFRKVLQFCFV